MKTKLLFILLFVVLSLTPIHAQLANEIKSYVDSTELLLNNGRRLIVQSIVDQDLLKAQKVFHLLQDEANKKQCEAFSYKEKLHLYALLGDWTGWFEQALRYKEFNKRSICYSFQEDLAPRLETLLVRELESLNSDEEFDKLNDEQQELLDIYFYLLSTGGTDDIYDKKYRAYKKKYSERVYTDFLKHYLPVPATKTTLSLAMGPAFTAFTGNLAEVVSPAAQIYMAYDLSIGRIYSNLYMTGGVASLLQPISFINEETNVRTDFNVGSKFTTMSVGISAGYSIINNKRWQIAPYASIGGYAIQYSKYEGYSDYPTDIYSIIDSFSWGLGLHTEFRFVSFNLPRYNLFFESTGPQFKTYLSMKLDMGYDFITDKSVPFSSGNAAYMRLGLVWGFGKY